MKKSTYISLFSFILIFSCQKDFYLEDLNEVNSQIEALQSQIQISESEETLLLSDKESLEAQILDVQNQLDQHQMSVEEALEKIAALEKQLIELEVIKDGIYELVLSKATRKLEQQLEFEDPWWLPNPENSEVIEIRDLEIVRYTSPLSYPINKNDDNNGYEWIYLRKVKDTPYYSDLTEIDTSEQDQFYKINLFKQQISLDTLLIVDQARFKSIDGDEEKFGILVTHNKYIKRATFPPVKTEQDLTTLFKETNNGFYSDPLYLSLDPSDPLDYLRVFIEDAKRFGVDLSHITNKEPYLQIKQIDEEGVCPWASDICDREKIWIEYDKACWEYGLPGPFYADRLQIMYHELGHTILSYDHPLIEDWEEKGLDISESVAEGFNGRKDDIMGYGFSNNWEHLEDPEQTWYKRLDRFFKGIDHEYFDCTTSKGSRIIVD